MFSKREFFVAVGFSLITGFTIGYSKAREKFMEALIKATPNADKKNKEAA